MSVAHIKILYFVVYNTDTISMFRKLDIATDQDISI